MSAKLTNFLKVLDTVKEDLTCGVCSQLCKDAVTLSKCFHLICSEHFEGLKNCPTCNISLEGCKTFPDKDLVTTISSTKELYDMFKQFRQDESINKSEEPAKSRRNTKKKESTKTVTQSTEKTIEKFTSQAKTDSFKKDTLKTVHEKINSSVLSNLSSKQNRSLNKRNLKGETTLHVACRLGKEETALELLSQGANPNTKDNAGWTPLHEAVQNNRLALVKLLIQHNALINVPGLSNESPLHEAIRYGHIDIIKELVINGANIHMRNIKGESPYDLANNELKEILLTATENIVQTQSVNVSHISAVQAELDYDDVRVYCMTQYRTVLSRLKTLTKHHDNLTIEAKFNKKVTHLIVDTEDLICTSSLEVLQAITNELWILSSDWVTKSSEDKLEPFEKYEVIGVGTKSYNGPKTSRYNKYKQLPGIFSGCHFYFHNFGVKYEISKQIVLNKAVLSKLVIDAGGVVLRRVPNPESIPESEQLVPYHARKDGPLQECSHYIIFKDFYEPRYNMKHLKALPVGWLIECIEKYELCDP